jgi:hypothetical protein
MLVIAGRGSRRNEACSEAAGILVAEPSLYAMKARRLVHLACCQLPRRQRLVSSIVGAVDYRRIGLLRKKDPLVRRETGQRVKDQRSHQ